MVRSETTVFLRQDPYALAVLTTVASDGLQQYLTGVRYKRDTLEVVTFFPILLLMEDHGDGMFPLLRPFTPPPNTNDDIKQSPAQGGITVEGDREELNEESVWSDSPSIHQ